jgi:hypothetical protein
MRSMQQALAQGQAMPMPSMAPADRIARHNRLAEFFLTKANNHPEGSDRRVAHEWSAELEYRLIDAISADHARTMKETPK